jgi:uncharacterized protein (TIGR03435 family)
MSLQNLAGNLEYRVPGLVVDETGLAGDWDFRLPSFRGLTAEQAAERVREEFGLAVSFEERPIEFTVIEAK